jgi:PTS system nitrogen regulatory IIA component
MSPIIRDIQTDLIIPNLKASNTRQIFLALANEVAIRTSIPADIIFEELMTKEQKSTSGIGDGVAIPHLRLRGLNEPIMMLVRLDEKVNFNSNDGQDVDMVFLLISPESDGPLHLRRLARVSRVLKNDTLTSQLRKATDAYAMRALFMAPDSWLMAA